MQPAGRLLLGVVVSARLPTNLNVAGQFGETATSQANESDVAVFREPISRILVTRSWKCNWTREKHRWWMSSLPKSPAGPAVGDLCVEPFKLYGVQTVAKTSLLGDRTRLA